MLCIYIYIERERERDTHIYVYSRALGRGSEKSSLLMEPSTVYYA